MTDEEYAGPERRTNNVSLAEVHSGIIEVAASMSELAQAITRNSRRATWVQTVWLTVLTLGVAFLSIIAVYNYQGIVDARSTSAVITDCVTPSGGCFQRNQQARNQIAIQAAQQAECDFGGVCAPGVTPAPTTTTTTAGRP